MYIFRYIGRGLSTFHGLGTGYWCHFPQKKLMLFFSVNFVIYFMYIKLNLQNINNYSKKKKLLGGFHLNIFGNDITIIIINILKGIGDAFNDDLNDK